jgi:hypothetical protein
LIVAGCSTSSPRPSPPPPTILACAKDAYSGPSVAVTLTAQEQEPTTTVNLGEEVVLGRQTNPGSSMVALPQTTAGAFCKRGDDADHWYLIAEKRGRFRLLSYFLGADGGGQDILTAFVVVR